VEAALLLGLFWILVAGVTQGAFPLPMKYSRLWRWEHLWFWYSVLSFFVLPVVLAFATVPNLAEVYSRVPGDRLLLVVLFGMGWGIGSVFFGLGLDALGMALGFPLMTGLFTSLGALIPLVVLTPDLALTPSGMLVIAGNAITIAGVAVCAIAGKERDIKTGRGNSVVLAPRRSFAAGLAICVAGGVFSAMFNFGYAFGSPVIDAATGLGSTPANAVNALWLIELPAGGVINIVYCAYLLRRNHSWALLGAAGAREWSGVWIMALLWTASVLFYGWGATYMGVLGPTLWWSLWNAILIVTTMACGVLTREWDGARGRPLNLLTAGVAILIAGMFMLGMSASQSVTG
jgi:L-rhamnose-H+ transport protein